MWISGTLPHGVGSVGQAIRTGQPRSVRFRRQQRLGRNERPGASAGSQLEPRSVQPAAGPCARSRAASARYRADGGSTRPIPSRPQRRAASRRRAGPSLPRGRGPLDRRDRPPPRPRACDRERLLYDPTGEQAHAFALSRRVWVRSSAASGSATARRSGSGSRSATRASRARPSSSSPWPAARATAWRRWSRTSASSRSGGRWEMYVGGRPGLTCARATCCARSTPSHAALVPAPRRPAGRRSARRRASGVSAAQPQLLPAQRGGRRGRRGHRDPSQRASGPMEPSSSRSGSRRLRTRFARGARTSADRRRPARDVGVGRRT
jgi:hypothetical protein